MSDLGLTHIAFAVRDLADSIAFYAKFASMEVIHRRRDQESGGEVAWVTDRTRPFVIVLVQSKTAKDTSLGPFGHLGIALPTREAVNKLAAAAREDGCLLSKPTDSGPPVGYWTFLSDPDGNTLELSYGQEIAFIVGQESAVEG
ncbi:MAG: VOC family protein [Parerythrobacter sp.]